MPTITIPKHFAKSDRLVAIPHKEYARLIASAKKERGAERPEMTAEDVLRLSREAKQLHKEGKLPLLRSLKELRNAGV